MAEELERLRESFDWRRALRDARRSRKVSQTDVARKSGLSLSSIKAYESGDRHPSLDALTRIIDAIGLPADEATRVRAGAGYAIDWQNVLEYSYEAQELDELAAVAETCFWPAFVTNQATEVLCANRAFRLISGIGLDARLPDPDRSFLATASDPTFADRLVNWDEAMTFMLGIAKGERRWDVDLERPTPFLVAGLQKFLAGDPQYIRRVLEVWEQAPAVKHALRLQYNIKWRHDEGTVVSFRATMHVADIWKNLRWHDWIPQDATTIGVLQDLAR